MKRLRRVNLRKVNNGLTVVAVLLALYLILAPFLPLIWWWAHHIHNKQNPSVVQVIDSHPSTNTIPSGYWLDIPRLSLHREIQTESSVAFLDKGPWHVFGTSTPDKGSNTVIAGHRFGFTSPYGPFYFLNMLQMNDRVTVDWQGTEYTYKVVSMETVPPTQVSIQDPTKDPTLTLFTCTPLWSAKDRLVVQADLVTKRSS
jgi:sortase A